MPTTYYTNANGMILGERTGNGPHTDYIPDALGSVVAAVDQNLVTTYTAAYSPFGDVIASTGTAPNVTWIGTLGYLQSAGRPFAEYSVRNRIYSSTTGRWTSVDPYWPNERPYGYAGSSPTLLTDPTGLFTTLTAIPLPDKPFNCSCSGPVLGCAKTIQWAISSRETGWIVQYVSGVVTLGACVGPSYSANLQPFYEAWRVVNGFVYCGSATMSNGNPGTDTWGVVVFKPACSVKTITTAGEAYFFKDPKASEVINWRASPGTCGSPLPNWNPAFDKRYDPSVFWDRPDSNEVSRIMTTTVNCCGSKCNAPGNSCCQIKTL